MGMKIKMSRANPIVCFEMDQIVNIHHWKSVIAFGMYEELQGSYARNSLHKLVSNIRNLLQETHPHVTFLSDLSNSYRKEGNQIVFQININEVSGRSQSPG